MAKRKTKRSKAKSVFDKFLRPTPEREAANDFRSAGAAVQLIPVIDQLRNKGVLNAEEHKALAYYRDQASLADKSPIRDSCDFSVRGGGNGPGVAIMSAAIETGRMEHNMGVLCHLVRAVAVDDWTLERWCLHEHGAAVFGGHEPCDRDVGMATLELKYAAGGIIPR